MAPVRARQLPEPRRLTIHGYLTSCWPDARSRNLACIVNPHGGPWRARRLGLQPEVQFANRGFAVLHGTSAARLATGRKFWEAGTQWGLEDGGRYQPTGCKVIDHQGIADLRRIGIDGGSYARLRHAGRRRLLRPTCTRRRSTTWGYPTYLPFKNTTIPPLLEAAAGQDAGHSGDLVRDKARLEATFAQVVDRIKTPLFIAQGLRTRASTRLRATRSSRALRQRGVEVEYMVKGTTKGYGFHNDENKFEFYAAMENSSPSTSALSLARPGAGDQSDPSRITLAWRRARLVTEPNSPDAGLWCSALESAPMNT